MPNSNCSGYFTAPKHALALKDAELEVMKTQIVKMADKDASKDAEGETIKKLTLQSTM